MPAHRTSAVSFVSGESLYVFGGRTETGATSNDFFRYDATSDTWTQLPTPPLKARVKAAAIVMNNAVYIGLGFNGKAYGTDAYLHDWWRYDLTTETWTQLADFAGTGVVGALTFPDENKQRIYTLFGGDAGFTREVAYYDIAKNEWTVYEHNIHRAKSAFGTVGGYCDGRYFMGTGYHLFSLDQWFEFYPEEDIWKKRANVPGKRELASAVASDKIIYILGGYHFGGSLTDEKTYDDILAYDVDSDKWQLCGHLPNGSRKNMIVGKIGNRIYFGLGENGDDEVMNDFYYWTE